MKIGVIGRGYVGNAVQYGFEKKKFIVKSYDKFKESDSFEDVAVCEFIFICVPTPSEEDGSIDLSSVDEVIERLADFHSKGIIIIKSTVIPGTTQNYQNKYPDINIIFNPEFLTAITAEDDFLHPDKIIIGYTIEKKFLAEKLVELYKEFETKIRVVKSEEAEMIKYMINTYYATRVIFANEIYDICKAMNINYEKVKECFELDKRVAPGHFDVFHSGYRGYSGGCLPKEVDALISKAKSLNLNPELFKTLREINKKLRR